MRKIIIFAVFLLLLINNISAIDECKDEIDPNTACIVITPPITCSTYDLYNSSYDLAINDGTMSEISTGKGVYNFTFNQSDNGVHTIVLCDNTTSTINVETTDETDLGTILSNQITLNNQIVSVNDTGNIYWVTATDFQTEANASTRFLSLSDGIQNNATNITNTILANITLGFSSIIISDADLQQSARYVWNNSIIPIINRTTASRNNISEILIRIGNPASTQFNATSLMSYIYGNYTSPTEGLLARIWHYAERLTHGVQT